MTALGENLTGTVLDGKYELQSVLGEGGMSVVYRARRIRIGDEVALKILRPEITRDIVSQSRFEREAQVAARIKHPNIVTVHDFGTADGYTYLVMELLAGSTLEQEVRNYYFLPIERLVSILVPVCQAVGAAHREGVVHRDLKPSNILLHRLIDGQEIVKVVDFGIVKTGRASEHRLTQANIILGTPPYMSPEQCYGREIDHRSDIYSLGVIAYEALTGELPFDGLSVLEIMEAHVKKPALPLRQLRSDIPPAMEFAVLKALSKQPDQRYETTEEFARALAEALGLELKQYSTLMVSSSAVAKQFEHSIHSPRKTTRREIKLDTCATLKARPVPDFTRFVCRQKEMERLQNEYSAFLHGRGRPVIVSGEQGVGLSRFGEMFELWARDHGAKAMLSRFYEPVGGQQPLQFWLDLVRRVLDISRIELTAEAQLAEMITTKTGVEVPECVLQGSLSGDSEKWRVFEVFNLMLLRALANQPGVLIFDNLQYADPFSLEMLSYLQRNSRNCIFLVFLVRQEILAKRTHPVSEWALRATGCESLRLQPFSRQDLRTLLESIFGRIDLTERHLDLLWDVTKGNPFYVSEIVRLVINDGRLKLDGEVWRYTEPKAVELPGSLQQLAEMRLQQLSQSTLELLKVAAVIGHKFSLEILLEICGRDEDEVVDVLEQAVRNGILEEGEERGEDYRFRDLTLTLVLYRSLTRRYRRQIHRQVAELLASQAGSIERKRRRLSGRILYHYHEAGEHAKVFYWARLAAEVETARMDVMEADKYYRWGLEAAVELEEDGADIDQMTLGELYLGQATTSLRLNQIERARTLLGDALKLAQELKSTELEARAKLVSSQLKFALNELEEAISEAEYGLELAQRCGIRSLESAFLMMLARTYNRMGKTEDALAPLECNLELARQLEDASTESQVLSMLARIFSMVGNFRQAETFLEDALRLARERKDRLSELLALLRMGQLSCQLGQYDRALEIYELGLDMVRPLQDKLLEGAFLNGLGDVYLAIKEVDSARNYYQKYLQISEVAGNYGHQAIASYKLALLALELGVLPDALERLEQILKQAQGLGDQRLVCDVLSALGNVYGQMGRLDEAKNAYLESIALAEQTVQNSTTWEAHYGLASVFLMEGRHDDARTHAATAVEMLEGMVGALPDTISREEFLSDKQRAYSLLEELKAIDLTEGENA